MCSSVSPLGLCTHAETHLLLQAVGEKCGKKEFTFINSQVTPKESLWTASIDMTYSA